MPGHLVQAGEGWATLRPARNPILIFVSSAFGVWGEPQRVVCLAGSWGLSSRGWSTPARCVACAQYRISQGLSHTAVLLVPRTGGASDSNLGRGQPALPDWTPLVRVSP